MCRGGVLQAGVLGAGDDREVAGQGGSHATRPARESAFAGMRYDSPDRYVVSARGTFRLTPTELLLVRTLEELDGKCISKRDLADRSRRNAKVVSRLLSHLRHEGIIETEATYREDGGRAENRYRIAAGVHPLHVAPDLPRDPTYI